MISAARHLYIFLLTLATDDLISDVAQRKLMNKFITSVVDFLCKLLACIYFLLLGMGNFFVKKDAEKSENEPEFSDAIGSQQISHAKEEDFLHPCWQRLQNLESMVTELVHKPTRIPPEKDDILLESLNRIKSIEYDLQKTKKVCL